jgi:mono/diheme cytochrome c family protein
VHLRGPVSACAVLAAALVLSGCGSSGLPEAGAGDTARGKQLFTERCGSCHVLADAGTKGQVGPNLDHAFLQSRADGLGETTIEAVVRGQISYPVENPPTGTPGMPADIVTGEDADSVAAYVASVAALPVRAQPGGTETGAGTETGGTETGGTDTGGTDTGGAETGGAETGGTETGGTETGGTETGGGAGEAPNGEAIFAEAGCGGCHTLEAAGAGGTIGPNLDESQPTKELVVDRVTNGRGAMPAFKDSYSAEQIDAVADFVVASTE